MKNLDIKKLLVLVGIIVVVVGGMFLFKNIRKSSKLSNDETAVVEDLAVTYFANLTQGYSTAYSGVDVLYSRDKTILSDLTYGSILNTAIKYAQINGIGLGVSQNIIDGIKASGEYDDIASYIAYDGEVLNPIIEKLFGEDALSKTTTVINYLYEYKYVSENNIYLMRKSKTIADYNDSDYYMDCAIVKTVKDKDTYKTTIAVAYVYNNDGTYTYYKNADVTEEVSSGDTEFPKKRIKDFEQFTITMNKNSDGNYIFESVEKVS